MAEQAQKVDIKKVLSTIFKVVLGLIFLGLGAFLIIKWWPSLKELIKGSLGLFLILAGIITLAIAKE